MVLFVFLLEAAQDRDRVLDAGLVDHHRLEPAGKCRVLLDMLPVFVERGRADAMQIAARQGGLQEVRSVHRAVGLAGADQRVHLVDEQDHAASRRRDFRQHGLQPLLELTAVFCAGDQRAHVERHKLLILQRLGNVAIDYAKRQPFRDGGLADAGFADQHRIVLGTPRQHLDGAADFLVAADHRVELSRAGVSREIPRVFLQRIIALLGTRRIGGTALAQIIYRLVQRLRGHASFCEDIRGLGGFLDGEGRQQALDGHETVAGFLGHLFGGGENLRHGRSHIELAVAAFDFRHRVECCLDAEPHGIGVAARAADKGRSQPFLVVDQDFQKMFGGELLVAARKRHGLSGLDETAYPLRVFFDVHKLSPLHLRPALRRRSGLG